MEKWVTGCQSSLSVWWMNGVKVNQLVLNRYAVHTNLPHGKVDKDLRRNRNIVTAPFLVFLPQWHTCFCSCSFFLHSNPLLSVLSLLLPTPSASSPPKGRAFEEHQHWLHIKLMYSLPNSNIPFISPQANPLTVSLWLYKKKILCCFFHSHFAFFCPRLHSHL